MSLSCDCDYDLSLDDVEWLWHWPNDYSVLRTKRGRRCCSCGAMIKPGDTVMEYIRRRAQRSDIEWRIYDEYEGVPLASWFHCETCADLASSLADLGFCISIEDDMRALVKEYAATYGAVRGAAA